MAIFPALGRALLSRPLPLTTALVLLAAAGTPPARAQVTPDTTLGSESSTVTPAVPVRGGDADLIEGGARRGSNLFHSFQEFNVDAGQRLYFASPAGVESILSRITGSNPSNIFGTLGVDGAADLFLINPNGLVFDETAALDIQGSFYASTAEAIPLGNGVYSATAPEQSTLLTVNPSAFFSTYLSDASGNIVSRTPLAAGENLTLAANQLNLQRQVAAGGDLTLLGNTVQIRDGVDAPFIGFAGGDLLVQGNEQVDIVALSHPDSGLYSYGDMVLRSANPVGGDAHYWSGGNFTVETLNGSGGGLYSPIDPIVRALGDVSIADYRGSSLHILAGGAVTIGTAEITAPDPGILGIDFLQETIILSDGTMVQIDGGAQPTLDIRAGINPEILGPPPLALVTGFAPATDAFLSNELATATPSSADITIGNGLINAPNGLVLLTNQYQPNTNLTQGNIFVVGDSLVGGGINASGQRGQGGAVYLDGRDDVSIINSSIATSGAGTVGDIVINAGDTVRFERQNRRTVAVSNLTAGATGTGGDIFIRATNVELINGAQLAASTFGNGNAGNVVIEARDRVLFDNSDAFSDVLDGAIGTGGGVTIAANSLAMINGAQLSASSSGTGDAGNVVLEARDRIVFDGTSADGQFPSAAFSTVDRGGEGAGGNIEITTNSLAVTNGARLQASTFGNGDAGNVLIAARDRVVFEGSSADGRLLSAAFSTVQPGAEGAGGNIEIAANSLAVSDEAQLAASTSGRGDAGSVVITVRDRAVFDNSVVFSNVSGGAQGAGGNVTITAHSLAAINGAELSASSFGTGDAGDVMITARDRVVFAGSSADGRFLSAASSIVGTGAEGSGGNVAISTNSLEVANQAQLVASTFGTGDAGNVVITARDRVVFEDRAAAFSRVETGALGSGGNVEISANSLEVINQSQLVASTRSMGNAGNVVIQARDFVVFEGTSANGQLVSGAFSAVEAGATGSGGNIEIAANALAVTRGAQLVTDTRGTGDAGNVVIQARDRVVFEGTSLNGQTASGAFSAVGAGATGAGGNIEIAAIALTVANRAQLAAGTRGNGDAGNVVIRAGDAVVFNNGSAFSNVGTGATGAGGNVEIAANALEVVNGAQLQASTSGNGDAGEVMIAARDRVNLQGFDRSNGRPSAILTNNDSAERSRGNDIRITAPQLLVQDGATLFASTVNDQPGGNIVLDLRSLAVLNGGQVVAGSLGAGPAGTLRLEATEGIVISGSDPTFAARAAQNAGVALFAIPQSRLSVRADAGGAAGNILIGELGNTSRLELDAGGQITAESAAVDGGNIVINLNNLLVLRNGSQISTTAGTAQAGGNGGNITLRVPFIVAIPSENSDIRADAFEGAGGNIDIAARGIFGIEPRSQRTTLSDITASSALGVSGVITLQTLDTEFIENNLTALTDALVDTSALTAGSCIARSENSLGAFVVTGRDGLPATPGDGGISAYPTGTVRTVDEPVGTQIQEPDGVYQLPNGRLVLGRACN